MELREHKSSFRVFWVLRCLVILCIVRQFFLHNYEACFFGLLTLVLLYLPSLIQVTLKIEIPIGLEIAILFFIFAAEILGEINAFYQKIHFWDTMLHTINGFLCAAIGFSLVLLLNNDSRLTFDLSPLFLALVAFCFSMTIGVLWEFFECFMDLQFGMDMQKDWVIASIHTVMLDTSVTNTVISVSDIKDVIVVHNDGSQEALGLGGYLDIGIIDTMKDLFVNFIGAVVFSVFGYLYAKSNGQKKVVSTFMPSKKTEETDYLNCMKDEH
ncbi:MAG: hypothetical protein IKU62_04295 [Ruminiclostridium sp.]|nr:hypothetical protein [Ruminiclostridium sp.]